jgi:hypothetical protein
LGLPGAFAQTLPNYTHPGNNPRDLMWDFTVLHWYNDVGYGNHMGDPADYSGSHLNAYQLLYSGLKPVIVTEFGSSIKDSAAPHNNNPANDSAAGTKLTEIMAATERGVVGAQIYQLYTQPSLQTDYLLYRYTSGSAATIAPQGTTVKSVGHGQSSVMKRRGPS